MTWTQTLPELTQRERDCTLAVITKQHRYPFGVKTRLVEPTPPVVREKLGGGEFFRQPYPRTKFAIWLFEDESLRTRFLETFDGEPLP